MSIEFTEKQKGFMMGADYAYQQMNQFLNERIHYHGGARTVQGCMNVLNDMIEHLNSYKESNVESPQEADKAFYIIVDNTKL